MTVKLISTNKDEHYVVFSGKRKPKELIEILSQFPEHLDITIEVDYEDVISWNDGGERTTFKSFEYKD
jgi:hypothetical protein